MFGLCHVQISPGTSTNPIELFRDFPQYLQVYDFHIHTQKRLQAHKRFRTEKTKPYIISFNIKNLVVLQFKLSVVDFPYKWLEFDPVSSQLGFVTKFFRAVLLPLYISQTDNFSFINNPSIVLYTFLILSASLINQLKEDNINYLLFSY
jgi:hypothetical protein